MADLTIYNNNDETLIDTQICPHETYLELGFLFIKRGVFQ